jgi:hypothetical protein
MRVLFCLYIPPSIPAPAGGKKFGICHVLAQVTDVTCDTLVYSGLETKIIVDLRPVLGGFHGCTFTGASGALIRGVG